MRDFGFLVQKKQNHTTHYKHEWKSAEIFGNYIGQHPAWNSFSVWNTWCVIFNLNRSLVVKPVQRFRGSKKKKKKKKRIWRFTGKCALLHPLLVKKKCLLLIKEVFATLALLFFPNNTKYCTPHKCGGLERG